MTVSQGYSQKKDSLERILAAGNLSSQQELQTLEALYREVPNMDSISGLYLRRALALAIELKDYTKQGQWSVAFFHSEAPGMRSVQEKISVLLRASIHEGEISDTRVRGNIFLKLGGAYFNLHRYDSAIHYYEESIPRFGPEDSIYVADAKFFTGQAYDYQGSLIQAMQSYQEARDLYEALGDQEYVDHVLGGMAILFSRYGIYREADQIRDKLIQSYRAKGNTTEVAIQLYNKAEDLRKQNNRSRQLEILQEIEKMGTLTPENKYFEVAFLLSLANFYGEKGDLGLQTSYFRRAQGMIPEVPAFENRNPTLLYAQVLLQKNEGKKAESLRLAQDYLDEVMAAEDLDHQIRAREILALLYRETGREKEAAKMLSDLMVFKDSVNSANQSATFAYYQTLYETEKKEREILNKTQELEETRQKAGAQIRLFLILLSSLLVIGIGGFLLKNLHQVRKEKALQEKYSRDLLLQQEEERKRISKDLHDGLGQSLLLIKNRVALSKDENTGDLLDTAISELRTIARSLHPMQLEKLGLAKAAEQLLGQIDRETDLFVSSEIDPIQGLLNKDQELHLYRILQECLNNILKHAKATAIRVGLQKNGNSVRLEIEDNGQGFDFSERFQDFQSLGLKTLKERTAAIEGSMKVQSEKGKGSHFTFTVHV
jgi:signal transduction histidine kinase